jgi:hypothetical protein
MAAIPFTCVAPVDDDANARRRLLRQRMRLGSIAGVTAFVALAACVAHAYLQIGPLMAIGFLAVGCLFLFEAFRQADQRFIAPLQARCQEDYNRQLDALLGPLFRSVERQTPTLEERVDA